MTESVEEILEDKEIVTPLPPPVLIENWLKEVIGYDRFILTGNVYNHPNCIDGELIQTTKVVWISNTHAQTQNTLYKLGKPYEGSS